MSLDLYFHLKYFNCVFRFLSKSALTLDKNMTVPFFPAQNSLVRLSSFLWRPWDLVSRFPCCSACPSLCRHLEFLIWLLIDLNLRRPSWIWETIEPIVLETIAYCLSRRLVGYLPYEPCILLSGFVPWPGHRVVFLSGQWALLTGQSSHH